MRRILFARNDSSSGIEFLPEIRFLAVMRGGIDASSRQRLVKDRGVWARRFRVGEQNRGNYCGDARCCTQISVPREKASLTAVTRSSHGCTRPFIVRLPKTGRPVGEKRRLSISGTACFRESGISRESWRFCVQFSKSWKENEGQRREKRDKY